MSVYAQEYGQFFNSNNGDRTYNADSMETFMKPFFESGVFANCLQVTAKSTPSMSLNVAAGYAYLDGKTAYWPVTNEVTLANASGVYNRIDTVVLRRDDTNRRISIEVVTGTASASPQPTAPTRNGDIFELVLAQIYVGVGVTEITQANITDKRPDTDVCGYVMCTIETPDFSELYAQFEEQAAEAIESGTDDFMTWYDHMKDQLDEDAAGHLQLEIDAITDEIGDTALPTTAQTLTGGIAENNQEAQDLKDAIGIVINGNTAARSVAPGQYVIVKKSTITGITNGLYKYSGSTTKTAGNSFTSSELTAEPEGGLNALNGNIGDIASLTTSSKTSTVDAINELNGYRKIQRTSLYVAPNSSATFAINFFVSNSPYLIMICSNNVSAWKYSAIYYTSDMGDFAYEIGDKIGITVSYNKSSITITNTNSGYALVGNLKII